MKRRSIIHRHAHLRSGAGTHKTPRRQDVIANEDWVAVNYERENEMLMTLKEFRAEHGIESGTDMQEALTDWVTDSVVPAMCKDGCEVEPDGICEHGCPSILVAVGVV
jgi:hypothetical protein